MKEKRQAGNICAFVRTCQAIQGSNDQVQRMCREFIHKKWHSTWAEFINTSAHSTYFIFCIHPVTLHDDIKYRPVGKIISVCEMFSWNTIIFLNKWKHTPCWWDSIIIDLKETYFVIFKGIDNLNNSQF